MKKPLLRLISIVLSIFMLFSLSACNQTKDSEQATGIKTKWHKSKNNGVIFSARTDKDSYVIGEEIKLYFKIENKRDSAIVQTVPIDCEFGPITIIKNDSHQEISSLYTRSLNLDAASDQTIKSNEVYESAGSDEKGEVFSRSRFYTDYICEQIEEKATFIKPPAGKYTVISELSYVDMAKLVSREEYNRELEETQTVEFEITLTDAPTTTAE